MEIKNDYNLAEETSRWQIKNRLLRQEHRNWNVVKDEIRLFRFVCYRVNNLEIAFLLFTMTI